MTGGVTSLVPGDADDASITYRVADRDDLLAIGRIYVRAFPDTLGDLRSPDLSPQAAADVMSACLAAEADCIVVAQVQGRDGGKIAGYVIAPSNVARVWRTALRRGLLLVWLWRTVSGRYRLSARGVLAVLGDKLSFWRAWGLPGVECEARILSIAVDPAWQGRGIGRRLLEMTLGRLRARRVACVRLEVRPDNEPALRLYRSVGFRPAGDYRDSRGRWEIMLLQLRATEHG